MKILRSPLIAALSLGLASPALVACAEKPGTKKNDDAKAKKDDKNQKDDKDDKNVDKKKE